MTISFNNNSMPTEFSLTSRTWFATLDYPEQHHYSGTPIEICKQVVLAWEQSATNRSAACSYCLSKNGMPHLHMVLCSESTMRRTAVINIFPSAHVEQLRGSKRTALSYILKEGLWEDNGEEVIAYELGKLHKERTDNNKPKPSLNNARTMIEAGMKPDEIFEVDPWYRKIKSIVREEFFQKLERDTPPEREIKVYWHTGESGSGKSHIYNDLVAKNGEREVYFKSDTQFGWLDDYEGQRILIMDEFRGDEMKFKDLLSLLQGYRQKYRSRYNNVLGVWNEVHITSVLSPESVYRRMVPDDSGGLDSYRQLLRRISEVIFHWRDGDDFYEFHQSAEGYSNYEELKSYALTHKEEATCLTHNTQNSN